MDGILALALLVASLGVSALAFIKACRTIRSSRRIADDFPVVTKMNKHILLHNNWYSVDRMVDELRQPPVVIDFNKMIMWENESEQA